MRRVAVLAAVLLPLVCLPAAARGVESVTIEAENALPGIWRFPPHERRSDWTKKGSDVVAAFAAMGPEKYCRIGRTGAEYVFNCLEMAERMPRAVVSGSGRVQLSWAVLFGVPGCRWSYRGHLDSGTQMTGHLGMSCGMVLRENSKPMTLNKMVLSSSAADDGGQASFLLHLLEEMAAGAVTGPIVRPHFVSSNPQVVPLPDDVQQKLFLYPAPEALRLLGKITLMVYIGTYTPIVGWWYDGGTPVYSDKHASVYAVEFENGERLCALHRRPDGVLDLLQCI